MHRDWITELMVRLADRKANDPGSYLALVDERLDALGMDLMEFKRAGVITNRTMSRGLSRISALRTALEAATCDAEVRDVFQDVDDLRYLFDEANAILKERG